MNNELRIKIWCICFLFIIAVVGLAFIGINCVSEQVVSVILGNSALIGVRQIVQLIIC